MLLVCNTLIPNIAGVEPRPAHFKQPNNHQMNLLRNHMKPQITKRMLMLLGISALLTGCATQDRGALGNDSQKTYLEGSSEQPHATGLNGSASTGNPLAIGTGTGMTR